MIYKENSLTATVILSGLFLLLSNIIFAQPVKTFPELLEKIKEHREMIKDVSGTINYGYDENDPMEILNHFVYVNGEWKISSETIRPKPTFVTDLESHKAELITENDFDQYTTAPLGFSYNPDNNSVYIHQPTNNKESPFGLTDSDYKDPFPFIGVDTFGWTRHKVEELYKDIQNSEGNTTVTPIFTMDDNLLLLTVEYQCNVRDMHETLKLWFDPDKQYSIVRCHEGQIFDWHSKKSEIEMVAVGDPPVYFPRKVSSRLFHKSDDHEDFCGENVILYENIKINSGLTKDDVNIKLPKDTKVYNSINDKHMITTADNVTLDQILARENVASITEDEYFGREKEEETSSARKAPPPTKRKVNPLLTWRFWVYVIEFLGLGLLVLLLVRYRSLKKPFTPE